MRRKSQKFDLSFFLFFQVIYGSCVTVIIYLLQGKIGYHLTSSPWLYLLAGQVVSVVAFIGVQVSQNLGVKRKNSQQVAQLVREYFQNQENQNKIDLGE